MTSDPARPRGVVARALVAVIGLYRTGVSPIRPATCRYTPTCSAYALEAVSLHGAGRGSWLSLRRLLRCHPLHAGGHDPVPPVVGRPVDHPLTRPADSVLMTLPRTVA